MMDALVVFSAVFTAWLALHAGAYLWIRWHLRRRGEPAGWRFNHHGAMWFPGHLSFYQRGGGHAVVFRAFTPVPLFWTVYRTPSSGEYSHMETVERGPAWSVIPWTFKWMAMWPADPDAVDAGGDASGS